MNYQKIVNLLTDIMPEIASTKDPEGVMLKCASDNNLYPAQLEKLGHAFNQAKTLVGLEKQANRGDSFTIVDVPAMVSKYATYDPTKVLTGKSKSIDKKIDNLQKAAGAHDMSQFERVPTPDFLDDLKARGAVVTQEAGEYWLHGNGHADVTFNKEASANELDPESLQKSIIKDLNEAEPFAQKLMYNTKASISEKCASIRDYLRKNGGQAWSEIVEDTFDRYGEKCASAVGVIEQWFEVNHIPYQVFDLTKRAHAESVIEDRHNMWPIMEQIMSDVELYKEASDALDKLETDRNAAREKLNSLRKEARKGPTIPGNPAPMPAIEPPTVIKANKNKDDGGVGNVVDSLLKDIKRPSPILPLGTAPNFVKTVYQTAKAVSPDTDTRQKTIDSALEQTDKDIALQKLMLGDPILANADPYKIQDLYNTINQLAPTLAKDPHTVSTVLKEAIQYDALPLNIIRDLTSIENTLASTKEKNDKLNPYKL